VFLTQGQQLGEKSALNMHLTRWIILNYVDLVLWVFVWMIDQTRMRGKNVGCGSYRSFLPPCLR
jgi:hypothetical protein